MTCRLSLVCHASTAATRASGFPADEPIDALGLKGLARTALPTGESSRCWTSPALRAIQTAEALGLGAAVEPALRECDHGRWRGRTLEAIATEEPRALRDWLSDPAFDGHGGESVEALIARVAIWLDRQRDRPGRIIAVTHASVMRAALVHALEAGARSFWRLDIAPLSAAVLTAAGGRWNLASIGPLRGGD